MSKDNIRRGLPAKRDPTCFEVQHDIVIPAGTILRSHGGGATFEAGARYGNFIVGAAEANAHPEYYKKVISA